MSVARIAVGTVELHLPDVGSLKGKRHVLKGLKERVRARFEVAVAEVDRGRGVVERSDVAEDDVIARCAGASGILSQYAPIKVRAIRD